MDHAGGLRCLKKGSACTQATINVEAKKALRNVTAVLYGFQRCVMLT